MTKQSFRGMSKSPGRNESERINGLESDNPRRPSLHSEGEGSMSSRKLAETAIHSGGAVVTAGWPGHAEQLEKPSSSQGEISGAR